MFSTQKPPLHHLEWLGHLIFTARSSQLYLVLQDGLDDFLNREERA